MKRITRRQARSWLSPMRDCFLQMLEGEVDAINGYPVTRLHHDDDYARIDYCIAGFRALLDRLCPEIDTAPLARLEKRLANGVPVTRPEIQQALAVCKLSESALLRHPVAVVKAAVLTEQIDIELAHIRANGRRSDAALLVKLTGYTIQSIRYVTGKLIEDGQIRRVPRTDNRVMWEAT